MKILMTFLLFFPLLTLMGQPRTVTGIVVDESGHPIPYATISSKLTYGKGTMADQQGNYKLEGIANKDTLVCSHINYQTRLEEVAGNNKIIFRLSGKTPALTFAGIGSYATPITDKQNNGNTKKEISFPVVDEQIIFTKIEVAAHYGNKPNSFNRYIEKVTLPDSISVAFDPTGEFIGTVVISFTVDSTGKVVNPLVIKGVDSVLDKVIVDALMKMPLWKPANQNGQDIASKQEVSIFLNIQQKSWVR